MISKSKKARDLANHANKQSTDRGAHNAELSAQELEGAMERLFRERPHLFRSVLKHADGLSDAATHIRASLYSDCGVPLQTERVIGEQLTAFEDGIIVDRDGRRGILSWEDIAEEAMSGDVDDELPAAIGPGEMKQVIDPAKPKGKTKSKEGPAAGGTNGRASSPAPPAVGGACELTVDQLDPNPFQPRHDFDKASIDELARSMQADGQVQPILVRHVAADRYQIGDGERRWRAAKQAGLRLMAFVRPLSDEQMAKLALVANLQRKDLNAIEEAEHFQLLIDKFGYTQPKIASEFGIDASQVSNRLRLLALPEAWRKRVISREIPPTHARSLLPFAGAPVVLAAMAKEVKGSPSLSEWDRLLTDAVHGHSRPMTGYEWMGKRGHVDVRIKPTDAQVVELCVVVVNRHGQKVKRALNVDLWEELQAAGEKAHAERQAKAEAKREASGKGKRSAAGRSSKPKTKKVDQAALFRRRFDSWLTDWLAYLSAKRLGEKPKLPPAGESAPGRILLWLACELGDGPNQTQRYNSFSHRSEIVERVLRKRKVAVGADLWKSLAGEDPQLFPDLAVDVARAMLFGDDGPEQILPPDIIAKLAVDLKIDRKAAWQHELAGPLTEEYFELHSKTQLIELAAELGVYATNQPTKAGIVKVLIASANTKRKLPTELVGKAKGKTKGKK